MYRDPSSYERLIGDTDKGVTKTDSTYRELIDASFAKTNFLLKNESLEAFFEKLIKDDLYVLDLQEILEGKDLLNDEKIEIDGIEFDIEDFCFYFGKIVLGLDDLEKGDKKMIDCIKQLLIKVGNIEIDDKEELKNEFMILKKNANVEKKPVNYILERRLMQFLEAEDGFDLFRDFLDSLGCSITEINSETDINFDGYSCSSLDFLKIIARKVFGLDYVPTNDVIFGNLKVTLERIRKGEFKNFFYSRKYFNENTKFVSNEDYLRSLLEKVDGFEKLKGIILQYKDSNTGEIKGLDGTTKNINIFDLGKIIKSVTFQTNFGIVFLNFMNSTAARSKEKLDKTRFILKLILDGKINSFEELNREVIKMK